MKAVRVIVNADDLGESPKVNGAIFGLLDRGLVTSATMIGNAPFVEETCRRVDQYPQCSFGAHLNVTQLNTVGVRMDLAPLNLGVFRVNSSSQGLCPQRPAGCQGYWAPVSMAASFASIEAGSTPHSNRV